MINSKMYPCKRTQGKFFEIPNPTSLRVIDHQGTRDYIIKDGKVSKINESQSND